MIEPPTALEPPFSQHERERYVVQIREWARNNMSALFDELRGDKFFTALSAYRVGRISFGGFSHLMSGDPGNLFLPQLGLVGCEAVLGEMAEHIAEYLPTDFSDIERRFPEFEEPYFPEAFGQREATRD